MGVKRPLGEENLPELSFKQPKHLDDSNQTSSFMTRPSDVLRIDCAGGETLVASTADNELEASQITRNGVENISKSEQHEQYLDPYVSLLSSFPIKEVPVGPDHQANLPNWDPHAQTQVSPSPNNPFLGICILCPNTINLNENTVGHGRADCSCKDIGSTRCVQQHVSEAREKLREFVGENVFRDLDFYSMGEVAVSSNWSADEEQLFHEVVSSSRNFWELLSFFFSDRTNEEIVRYYFNAFMLRRRAFQNRSGSMVADSDDDDTEYT